MNNNYDDNIRTPDPVKTDRLIDGYIDNFTNIITDNNSNYELDTILELSKNEFNNAQEKEEQKAIDLICNQTKEERQNKFNNVKIQLQKILLFDKSNLYYYELILSTIEMFENGFIEKYKINEVEHTNIFKLMKTIRVPRDELDNLKKLIVTEL